MAYHKQWIRSEYRKMTIISILIMGIFIFIPISMGYRYNSSNVIAKAKFFLFVLFAILVVLIPQGGYRIIYRKINDSSFGVLIKEDRLDIFSFNLRSVNFHDIEKIRIDKQKRLVIIDGRTITTQRSFQRSFNLLMIDDLDLFIKTLRTSNVQVILN